MKKSLPTSIQNLIRYAVESGAVTRIALFGSRARGVARENSDYDLAFWTNDRAAWSRLWLEIETRAITLLPVDLVLYAEASDDLKAKIDEEGLIIYGDE